MSAQRIAYWTTFAAAVISVAFSFYSGSLGQLMTGAFLLVLVLVGNPVCLYARDVLKIVSPFVEGLGFKLSGKVSPEMAAAVKSLNQAHENDKALDIRLSQIESKLNGLALARGFERKSSADAVSELVR